MRAANRGVPASHTRKPCLSALGHSPFEAAGDVGRRDRGMPHPASPAGVRKTRFPIEASQSSKTRDEYVAIRQKRDADDIFAITGVEALDVARLQVENANDVT